MVPEIIKSLRRCNAWDRGCFPGGMTRKAINVLEDVFGLEVSYVGRPKAALRSLVMKLKNPLGQMAD